MKKPNRNKPTMGQIVLLISAIVMGLAAVGLCALLFSGCSVQTGTAGAPKYVFLFVGDGMGTNQVAATRYFQAAQEETEGDIWRDSFDSFPEIGLITTHSLEQPTDSAASITAMLTGQKVHNEEINYSSEAGGPLEPFAKAVKRGGYAVGVVTSTSVDHATPAGMYASAGNRYSYDEIAPQGIAAGYLDFLGGGGFRAENEDELIAQARENGFQVYEEAEEIRGLQAGDAPVLALSHGGLDNYNLAYEIDRVRAAQFGGNDLSLAELTQAAITSLEAKGNFFLLCEGAKIDTACAEGDLTTALYEVAALSDAVKVAMEFYEKHPEDTLIVTLADHETGGLRIASGADFSVLSSQIASSRRFLSILEEVNEQGGDFALAMEKAEHYFGISGETLEESRLQELKEDFEDSTEGESFTKELCRILQRNASVRLDTDGHTGQPVPVYAMGQQAQEFSGLYDNTAIHTKLRTVLGLED